MSTKLLSLRTTALAALGLAFALACGAFAANAYAQPAEQHCATPDDCLVCEVAGMINALPEANEIAESNATAVIEQIHAIDRIKGGLSDEQYDELLQWVETGENGSGQGLDVPKRYVDAVAAIQNFGCFRSRCGIPDEKNLKPQLVVPDPRRRVVVVVDALYPLLQKSVFLLVAHGLVLQRVDYVRACRHP